MWRRAAILGAAALVDGRFATTWKDPLQRAQLSFDPTQRPSPKPGRRSRRSSRLG